MQKKNIAGKINHVLTWMMLFLLLPLLFTVFYQKMQINEIISGMQKNKEEDTGVIIGILAKEIHADVSDECLKAQAVIARTNYLAAQKNGEKIPKRLTTDEMKEVWGTSYDSIYRKMEQAVKDTEGETLQYKDTYIYAAFHALSAGKTRNIQELYPDADMPYLKSTDCGSDCNAPDYLAVLYWKKEEFLKKCTDLFTEASISAVSEIYILQKDEAGYVLKIKVGDKEYSGEEFRAAFNLGSACFTLTETEENIRIVTKGVGHGFGMSQYAAERMAEDGADYRTILNTFFPGAILAKK